MQKEVYAIILGAGKGTRMRSNKPKVLHEIFQKPILSWVIDCVNNIDAKTQSVVVVGHGAEEVSAYLAKNYPDTKTVLQKEQLGTGHAVAQAIPLIKDFQGSVIILCGDTPLITSSTMDEFIEFHNKNKSDVSVMTTYFDDPTGYGRIVRNEVGDVISIVEQKDATEIQKEIKEVNTGIYCLNWQKVKDAFSELKNNNAQKEYYLTDIIKWARKKSLKVFGYVSKDNTETFGINSRRHLAEAFNIMNKRYLNKLMDEGVTIVDPNSTYISPETTIGADTIVYPNCYIEGKNIIGLNCKIGPMAHLRGNCEIGNYSKIGNFVELKNAHIANNTNACHLTYIGDAQIGNNVNIGAGTIFANYNSITKEKKMSKLEDGVSIGSNSVIVAPVELKQNAFIAAMGCITKNVSADSLAMTRSPQKEIKDWVKSAKKQNKAK